MSPTRYSPLEIKSSIGLPLDASKKLRPGSDIRATSCSGLTNDDSSDNGTALSPPSLPSFSSASSSSMSSSPSSIATSPSLPCSSLLPSYSGSFAPTVYVQDHLNRELEFSSRDSSTTKDDCHSLPSLPSKPNQSQLHESASTVEHPRPFDPPLQDFPQQQHIGHLDLPRQEGLTRKKRGPLHPLHPLRILHSLESQQGPQKIATRAEEVINGEKDKDKDYKDENTERYRQRRQQNPQGQQRQQEQPAETNYILTNCSRSPQLTLQETRTNPNLGLSPSPLSSPLSTSSSSVLLPAPSCPLQKSAHLATCLHPSSALHSSSNLSPCWTVPPHSTLSLISPLSHPPPLPPTASANQASSYTQSNEIPPSLAITSPASSATPASPHPLSPIVTTQHTNSRLRQQSVPDLPSQTSPRQRLSRSSSASSIALCGTPNSAGTVSPLPLTAESTTSTTLSCAYSQPFLSVPSSSFSDLASLPSPNSIQQLRELEFLANQSPIDDMTRQRSQSTSSMGVMAKSPSSLVASLSTSLALYDSLQPPKSLQDILLLAQSHYISHRYVQALALYKLAAEQHHSLPACCSLYALYTSTRNEPGLIRSDTKAAHVLIHALRIWTARRWSSSRLFDDDSGSAMRSRTRDEHDELEEYFAPKTSKKRSDHSKDKNRSAGRKIPIRQCSGSLVPPPGARGESIQSEYRNSGILGAIVNEEVNNEPDLQGQQDTLGHSDDEGDNGYEHEGDSCDEDCEDCEDEEQEKEEEARRIGLATAEIEDIVQKICALIQKGVLALDEPIVVEAVAMLRKIERGLSTEADAWKQQQERSQSLFTSSLAGRFSGNRRDDELSSIDPGLLLTQGVDLSFLNFSPDEEFSIAQTQPQAQAQPSGSSWESPRTQSLPTAMLSPVNRSISNMTTQEQEADQAVCRAIRIRVMFTLGWVHQRMGEYHYGAQAYGVCSEITPKTGKRFLDSLQQEATVQKFTCRAFEKKALEQAQKEEAERKLQLQQQQQSRKSEAQTRGISTSPIRSPTPASTRAAATSIPATSLSSRLSVAAASSIKDQVTSRASSVYNSSESSSTVSNHLDVSSPSSPSGSETSMMPSNQGPSISGLSSWGSGLFKLSSKSATTPSLLISSSDKDKAIPPRLHRSKSVSHNLKINTLDALTIAVEAKDRNSSKPRLEQRPSKPPMHQTSMPSLTMVGHQTLVAKCGHCEQKRLLMPLCVCKKVRYCNRECRLADMEVHRKTGCHAAMIGSAGLDVAASGDGAASATTLGIAT